MPTLSELQHRFADAILAGAESVPALAIAGRASAAERIAIYRRTVRINYRNALAATYPVVRRLMGGRLFDATVDDFVAAHPSRGGDLNVYGDGFGAFLAGYAPARELPCLPDIARLEWAIDDAHRAADCPRAPQRVLEAMNGVAPDRLPMLRLRLDPSCRLIDAAFPILRIWQVNQDVGEAGREIPLDAGPDRLLVRRDPEGVIIARVPPATFAWLAALDAGEPLATALERALAVDAAFDLGSALHTHVGDGTLAGVGDVR